MSRGYLRGAHLGVIGLVVCVGAYRLGMLLGVCMALSWLRHQWRAVPTTPLDIGLEAVRQVWLMDRATCVQLNGHPRHVVWIFCDEVSDYHWRRIRRWLMLATPQTRIGILGVGRWFSRWV